MGGRGVWLVCWGIWGGRVCGEGKGGVGKGETNHNVDIVYEFCYGVCRMTRYPLLFSRIQLPGSWSLWVGDITHFGSTGYLFIFPHGASVRVSRE